MQSGGSVDVSYLGDDCVGYATSVPDFTFRWEDDAGLLRFYFVGDDDGDTTLVVHSPDRSWHCDDDSSGRDPMIDFEPSSEGLYEVWVASYNEDENVDGTLAITELSHNTP